MAEQGTWERHAIKEGWCPHGTGLPMSDCVKCLRAELESEREKLEAMAEDFELLSSQSEDWRQRFFRIIAAVEDLTENMIQDGDDYVGHYGRELQSVVRAIKSGRSEGEPTCKRCGHKWSVHYVRTEHHGYLTCSATAGPGAFCDCPGYISRESGRSEGRCPTCKGTGNRQGTSSTHPDPNCPTCGGSGRSEGSDG